MNNHKYNKDDIFNRSIIAGFVNFLNNKIFFINQLSDTQQDIIQLPFYFRFAGAERMIQDEFLKDVCGDPQEYYSQTPIGIINLDSMGIESSELTQRFIRASYIREVNGKKISFSANVNPLPFKFDFKVEIKADTFTDLSKIHQSIIETLFKTSSYNVLFKGFVLSCQFSLEDTIDTIMNTEYSFPDGSDEEYKLEFNVTVNTYFPVLDTHGIIPEKKKYFAEYKNDTIIYNSEEMSLKNNNFGTRNKFDSKTNLLNNQFTSERKNSERIQFIANGDVMQDKFKIKITNPQPLSEFKPFDDIKISWETKGYLDFVDLQYSFDGTTWVDIIQGYVNTGEFIWNNNLSIGNKIEVMDVENGNGAEIYALIKNGVVTETLIKDSGKGYSNKVKLLVTSESGLNCVLLPHVIDGNITDIDIVSGGSNFENTSVKEIYIKVKSSKFNSVSDIINENGVPKKILITF